MSNTTLIPINIDRTTAVHVVRLPERFDVFADVELNSEQAMSSTTLLLDGSNVRFADLHALQSLIDARLKLLDVGSELVVGAPSEELLATLELTGLQDLIPVISGAAQ